VANLIAVARFRQLARAYGLTDVSVQGKHLRFSPLPLPDSKQMRLKRYHPDSVYKAANDQVSVPRPTTRRIGGEPLRDQALLEWCAQLLKDVLGDVPAKVPA
jgi:transcription-repair coupling factor (superfamily II helicase)